MIWKVEEFYAYGYDFTVNIPDNSRFLGARTQDGQSYVAFLVSSNSLRKHRTLHVVQVDTYTSIDLSNKTYLGSFKAREGEKTCYIFDSLPIPGPLELLAGCAQ